MTGKKRQSIFGDERPAMVALELANESRIMFFNPAAIATIAHEYENENPRPGRCIVNLHNGAGYFVKGDPRAIAGLCGLVRGA